jgi:hypothetical protein
MLLLVTTPSRVLLFDAVLGTTTLLRTGDGEYYGASWNFQALVLSHSGIDNGALRTWQDYRNGVRGFLRFYPRAETFHETRTELLGPHQIECIGDEVLVTNTGRNCISVYNSDGSLVRHVHLTDVLWDRNEDGRTGNHFNSVHLAGDRLWVVAHNFERPSSVWELSYPGLEVVGLKETGAHWAHNVWVGEWGVVICDSKSGSLYEVISGNTIWKADEQPILTRGLAVSGNYIFVGRSEYGNRRTRKRSAGGIWVIDRKTLKTVDKFILPGTGCVDDIRLVEAPDECHNGLTLNRGELEKIKRVPLYGVLGYELQKRLHALPFSRTKPRKSEDKRFAQLR